MATELKDFIGKDQLDVLSAMLNGEEGEFFKEKLADIKKAIESMPGPYGTEGQGMQMKAFLHYFTGGSDWYIFEKDNVENEPQLQAFGFACINCDEQNAELGYINISEIIASDVELDLYYKPETLEDILEKHHQPLPDEDSEEESQDDGEDVPLGSFDE
ncbi:MAG: hypothetical protein PF482_21405 [Desulfobacteraceae bacterium]|nr:hypothetical protein [Desulfobacteraceae bacterium]